MLRITVKISFKVKVTQNKDKVKETKRSQKYHSLHPGSDIDSSTERCSPRHGNPRKHLKTQRFDGRTNWLSFKKKFDSYKKVIRWSEEESKDYLMWSLEGKALDFLPITKTDLKKIFFQKNYEKARDQIWREGVDWNLKGKISSSFSGARRIIRRLGWPCHDTGNTSFYRLAKWASEKKLLPNSAKVALTMMQQNMHVSNNLRQWKRHLAKHHKYISQAVDGKKKKKEYEASVNAVQSPSEARVEQLIRSALKGFCSKSSVKLYKFIFFIRDRRKS